MTWNDVLKFIAILSGTGITLATVATFLVWLFKEWILNIFKKDLVKLESNYAEKLKEKELKWQNENKSVELRLGEEIRKSELQITKVINFEQKYFQILLDAYNNTWNKLIDLEEFMIREYPYYLKQLAPGDPNDFSNPIRMKIHAIRKEMLFLPDTAYKEISNLMDSFFVDLSEFIKTGEELSRSLPYDKDGKKIATPEMLNKLGQKISVLQKNLVDRINSLRDEFRHDFLKEIEQNKYNC